MPMASPFKSCWRKRFRSSCVMRRVGPASRFGFDFLEELELAVLYAEYPYTFPDGVAFGVEIDGAKNTGVVLGLLEFREHGFAVFFARAAQCVDDHVRRVIAVS